ncbi:MAG: hypothetical protein AABX61_02355 [Nanoarchaeota archaeon]
MPELVSKEKEKSPAEKIEEIKKNAGADKNNEPLYSIQYDSLAEGLEPIYFWILDFMQDPKPSGLGMDEVFKSKDEYEAAVGSGFFSDLGAKATRMQEQAMKMMGTINTVVRSVINLIYDLREFEIRLGTYEDLKSENNDKRESAEIALRVLWMDQVDIKRGRGSINMLARELQFVTLRDAFIYAKSEEDVNNLDLNDRVKRILKSRINEYFKWKNYSEKELRKRYNIERAYLKSQFNSLKHYTAWVKPYLIAAKQLGMNNFLTRSGMSNPNIVNLFNNVEIHLNLLGKKKIKPEEVFEEYSNLKLESDYNSCIEVEITFRTVPRATQSQQGMVYLHSGKTQLKFRAYNLTDKQIDEMNKLQTEEDLDLIEEMTEVSLKEIQEDIEHFLGKPEEEKEKEKIAYPNPFSGIFKGFKQATKPLKMVYNTLAMKDGKSSSSFAEKKVKEYTLDDAKNKCYLIYDLYKKSHGMFTW